MNNHNSVQAQAPVLCRGTVISHHKETGVYLVVPSEGPRATGLAVRAVDMSSRPGGLGTLVEPPPLDIGTQVWYLDSPFLVWDGVSGRMPVCPIIGVDNTVPLPGAAVFPRWVMLPTSKKDVVYFTGTNDEVLRAFLGAGGISAPGDRSFGRPADSCNSDWLAVNAFKGYVRVGGDLVTMAAGPSCGISFATIEDMCVLTCGSVYVRDSACSREAEHLDGNGGFIRVNSFAFDPAAAMGSFGEITDAVRGTPLQDALDLKDDDSLPFWGLQDVAGNLAGGSLSTLAARPSESGLNTKGETPVPASSVHRGLDGTFRVSARHGLSLDRGFGIDVLRQLEDAAGALPEDPEEPEEAAPDAADGLSGEMLEYADQYAGLMHELMKKRFVERYLKDAKGKNWEVVAAERICREVFGANPEAPLPPLDADAPAYKLSDSMAEAEDPVRKGGRLKACARDSFIHAAPTGGIVLSDGHGSEIRMEGGNITITCPGDLKLLPGRDLVALVPRLFSATSQGRAEITSDKRDVVVRAGGSVSVTASKGTATLESLAPAPSKAKSMKDRETAPEGGGVIIRSATTTAVVGKNLRMGLQEPGDKSENGRQAPTGTLILDAGSGSTMLGGGSVYVRGEQAVSVAGGDSGLVAAGSTVALSGSTAALACSSVLMGGEGASSLRLTVPVIEEGKGIQSKEVGVSGGGSEATVSVRGNVLVSGGMAAETLTANTAAANTMACRNASAMSGIKTQGNIPSTWQKAEGVTTGAVAAIARPAKQGVSAMEKINDDPLFTAAGTKVGGVYYLKPEGYHCGKGFFWSAARWQRLLQGGQPWVFEGVDDPLEENGKQFPYPGKSAWEDDDGFIRTLEETGTGSPPVEKRLGSLSKGYATNATID